LRLQVGAFCAQAPVLALPRKEPETDSAVEGLFWGAADRTRQYRTTQQPLIAVSAIVAVWLLPPDRIWARVQNWKWKYKFASPQFILQLC